MNLLSLLEKQVREKGTLNTDFHNHLQTGSLFRGKSKNIFIEEGFYNLPGILDRVAKTNLDVLYITNFADDRFESWTSNEQLNLAIEAGYEIQVGNYFIFFKKEERVFAFGKSQEIPIKMGEHVLVSGLRRNKKLEERLTFDELKRECNDNEILIADHPYAISGLFKKSKEKEEQIINQVDCLERNGNFYFPFSWADWKVKRAAKRYKKSLIANADGHHPKDIGKTYNEFETDFLSYDSEISFRDSIKSAIIENRFLTHYSPIPIYRVFHHALMKAIYGIRKLLGKKDELEKYLS